MIDDQQFSDSHEFLSWWDSLNPSDSLDLQEAFTIFFNLETYDIGAV